MAGFETNSSPAEIRKIYLGLNASRFVILIRRFGGKVAVSTISGLRFEDSRNA